jgi:hypothetical protein
VFLGNLGGVLGGMVVVRRKCSVVVELEPAEPGILWAEASATAVRGFRALLDAVKCGEHDLP